MEKLQKTLYICKLVFKGALLTINDRVSGYVIIEKLNAKDAK